ncbi:MAG TPA: peptidase S58 [Firmicutes bacterium]|jgi:L-aminopeptidase/D-esterase-like protein|nr:peptidase S58 [Bacillota bacterium]
MPQKLLHKVGLKIGHYSNIKDQTGLTAFIAEKGAEIGIDIRGSSTGTLNTPAYDPKSSGKIVHAVVLTGGSIFGLESAFGVLAYLEHQGIGNNKLGKAVPGITGAVIYDLGFGNDSRPTRENGYQAALGSSYEHLGQGSIGVGTGATIGKWFGGQKTKGGFGIAAKILAKDIIVAAFVVTNAMGNLIPTADPERVRTDSFYQGLDMNHLKGFSGLLDLTGQNTTLAVIATNVKMDKIQLMKVAELAHDGMARSIYPVHTNLDGDVIFALSSLSGERLEPTLPDTVLVDLIGLAAADALVDAINNSVEYANS